MSLIKAFGALAIQSRSYVSGRALHPKQFTSILQDVPTRPRSGWQLYMNENLGSFKDPSKNNKIDLKTAMQELSAKWKAMPEDRKQVYRERFEAAAKLHDDSRAEALLHATSKQIKQENGLRRKYNLPLLRDPRQPKRGKNSFLLYLDHLRTSDSSFAKRPHNKDMIVEAGQKYRALSEAEKQVYRDQAKVIQEKYNQQMHKYYEENGLLSK
ncbi:hypothetical protein V8B55DRAFT_1383337 [Mucor lusitanicus]|uniref:HMG box domain-containing protein n=2 Tax=Mucor circinelloides f. lusitanicus TaxID=29924 RepID=A0A168QDR7_MUCCL|nr:hypothetical protein FB192DRAFT_1366223 [Mucor lusitanicus]OAD09101.1 hypothetical protein MUCCIDRAFT_76035 [Mucor lusitanicus CBS 277.49]